MPITTKHVDISNTEYTSVLNWASKQKGVWMNMLGGIRWDPTDNKFKAAPIKYSTVNLLGEKIKFSNGQEFMVIYSCLAEDFMNKTEVRSEWYAAAEKLKQQYIEQNKLENYIKSNNVDLKKLRQQGILQDQDELDNE